MSPHLLFLGGYCVLLVLVGLWIGRLVRSGGDFFVAGRGLSAGLLFSTFLAANIGAGSTVGATSLAYREGLSAWWWNGSAGLGSLVLALWIGPRLWRLARDRGYLTVGDFLEERFGREVSCLVAALIWLGTLAILAAQLIGAATILAVVGNVPRGVGYVVAAAVMTGYFVAGGLLSSAWVNRVQLVVMLAGFLLALPYVIPAAGGMAALGTGVPARLDFWHSSGTGSGWTWLITIGPAFIVSPGLLQKAYGARDERALAWGIGGNAAALLLFAFVPVLLGMAAAVRYPGLAHPNDALPAVLSGTLPPVLSALSLAAVLSAEVSSADAVLFMLSTAASRDLYRGFINRTATDAQLLRVARGAAVAGGLAGVGLAFVYATVEGALGAFYSLLTVTLFVPIVGGLLFPRAGRRQALGAILTGVPVLLWVSATTGGAGYGLFTPTVVGLFAAAAGFGITSVRDGRTTRVPPRSS